MIEFIFTMFFVMVIFSVIYGIYWISAKPNDYSIAKSDSNYTLLCNNIPFAKVASKQEAYLKISQLERFNRI